MNNVSLTGRITKDPELKFTSSGTAVCSFTIAVNRQFRNSQGEIEADFINCVAWRGQAQFVGEYVHKGNLLEITGSIQTRSYQTQTNETRVVTEVIVDSVGNLTPKPKEEFTPNFPNAQANNPFNNNLPF